MTKRQNARRRRRAYRVDTSQVLVVCGGVSTEPTYFNGLRRLLRNPAVKVKIASQGIDPKKLVEHAASLRSRGEFDDVWCVVDVDEYDLGPTISAAAELDIRLAISNPCFEYWLLLHFEACHACLPDYNEASARLRKYLPNYDKSELRFSDFTQGIADAVTRAKRRHPGPDVGEHRLNPSTRVWELVDAMQPQEQ